MPVIEAPSSAIKRMLAERRALKQAELIKEERTRMREVIAAFSEGARAGAEWNDPEEGWWASKAQRRLNPLAVRPGDAIRQMQHERRLRDDEIYAASWRKRRDELRSAFEEGHWASSCGYQLREYWAHSQTRRELYPGPPVPLHLRIKAAARHAALGDCPHDPMRDVGGPGQGR